MGNRTLRLILWLPLLLFLLFVGIVWFGLRQPANTTITSQMVGRPTPTFSLPSAAPGKLPLASASLADGRPRLVNIFASWCLPCVAEAPQLRAIAAAGVPIDGIAIRDLPADVADYLHRNGDVYQRIGADYDSRVQMAFGSSGVPETFIIDGRGVIRAQHIGEIRPEDVPGLVDAVRTLR